MSLPIRIGILGCGFAATNIHIPRLLDLNLMFEVTSVCDIVPAVARRAAETAGGAKVFADRDEMFESGSIDAVAVLTPLKAEAVLSALNHELDVFVEKPLAETPQAGSEIARMAEELDRVVLVGTMRAYDRAVPMARSLLHELGALRFVELRDVCSGGKVAAPGTELSEPVLQSAFDGAAPRRRNALQTALLEMVHDVAILRALFETDIHLLSARASDDGWVLSGSLVIGNDIPCLFAVCEYGLVDYETFLQELAIYGDHGVMRIAFSDPNTPEPTTVVTLTGSRPVAVHTDPYDAEWRAFFEGVRMRFTVAGALEEATRDLQLLWDIAMAGTAS